MIKRVYIDTLIVGGNFNQEFSDDTMPFFDRVRNGETLIVPDLLKAKLLRAPEFVAALLSSLSGSSIEAIKLSEEAIILTDKYIEAKVVGKTNRATCQHIAMATLCHPYQMIEIRTPKEIFSHGT